ncbi:MAG: hypothetical protein QM757_40760 [Paludibaculum sp.]
MHLIFMGVNTWELPHTLGSLRRSDWSEQRCRNRSVKDEIRDNLLAKLKTGEELFPGIVGYEDTVVPQVVNAVLSKHNFILLGLRGQAKTRLVRMLITLLDEWMPYVAGTEIRDNPFAPLSALRATRSPTWATRRPLRGSRRNSGTSKSLRLRT